MRLQGTALFSLSEIEQIKQNTLSLVVFPEKMERIYRQAYRKDAAAEFRYRGIILSLLSAHLSFGIYQTMPHAHLLTWLLYYSWVWIFIGTAWILSFLRACDQWFDVYTGLAATGAMAATFCTIVLLPNGQNNVLLHTAMVYTIMVVYGFAGLRFYTAIRASLIGGLIGFLISRFYHVSIEWIILNRSYTFGNFLGMALAYAIDRQYRLTFLHNCIINVRHLELALQSEQLTHLSQHDSLTGLANRLHLEKALSAEWHRSQRHQHVISVMMLDIDYFKRYNDSLGHVEGDECLRQIAQLLTEMTSRQGDLAARYGGEEFLLIFPNTYPEQAKQIAEELLRRLKQHALPHPKSDISSFVTISIGIASIVPQLTDDATTLIEQADQALYTAKICGRNQYFQWIEPV